MNHLHGLVRLDPYAVKRLRLRKCFPAAQTLEPLNHAIAVLKLAKLFDLFTRTAMTRHLTLSGRWHKVTAYRKIQQLWASNAFCCGLAVYQHCGAFFI
jgi:hypothetical protein